VGALIYHEPLDLFVLVGGAVMFSGNLISIRAEKNRSKIFATHQRKDNKSH